ncbi:hypothetical protein C2S52_013959 [Perilla frutescens var. hirtella]|nr:hypothetical protein C2S51_016202 [Perilla frutescens var. frutescens]KAH6776398.1 hypothetical protein C2S52_013959 [Perilla frutescens var. hirtella]
MTPTFLAIKSYHVIDVDGKPPLPTPKRVVAAAAAWTAVFSPLESLNLSSYARLETSPSKI